MARAIKSPHPNRSKLLAARWRALFALLLVALPVCWSLLAPAIASAHSQLLKSSPVSGSTLDTPPTEIRLELSEAVGLQFSTIIVYDRTRKPQQIGPVVSVEGDPNKVSAPITSKLEPGSYTVVWSVVSGIDGHLTNGVFAFRVRGAATSGTPEPDGTPEPLAGFTDTPPGGSTQKPDPLRWLLRGLILITAVLLTGGSLFTVLIMEPTVGERKEVGAAIWRIATQRFGQIGWFVACLLLLALLIDLVAQVATISSTDFFSAFGRSDVAWTLINSTRYGFAWTMRSLAAAILIGLFAWLAYKRPRTQDIAGSGLWELCIAAGSFLLLAEALSSHGAAVNADHLFGLPMPVVSDWLHLVTAAAWVGGLGYMGIALFPAFRAVGLSQEERRAFLARSIPRFSKLALLSIVALSVTGTYNLLVHSTDLGAILSSAYGQVVALKVGLLVVLVAIGAVNMLRLSPLLKRPQPSEEPLDPPMPVASFGLTSQGGLSKGQSPTVKVVGPVAALRRNIRIEIVLTTLVLLCAGGLTLLPPPGGPNSSSVADNHSQTPIAGATPVEQATPVPLKPVIVSSAAGGYNFTLDIHPGTELGDTLILTVTKALTASSPLTDVSKILFKVTPQGVGAGLGSASYEAAMQGLPDPDISVGKAEEPIFTLDGEYLVTAIVQRTESSDIKIAFRMNLSEDKGLIGTAEEAIEVRVTTDPSPPMSGTVTLTLTVVGGTGNPIDDAKLSILPIMPSHAHIQPLGEAQPVAGRPGVFTVPVHFTMGGGWLLNFTVERQGQPPVSIDASLDIIDPNATPTPGP